MTGIGLKRADLSDVRALLPLVEAYHQFEGVILSDEAWLTAIETLLRDPRLGAIWLIESDGDAIGYMALCYGYSIEFSGRDAFVDEFYLHPGYRRHRIGTLALGFAKTEARKAGIRALHLEVGRQNIAARKLYGRNGFKIRGSFHLMSVTIADGL